MTLRGTVQIGLDDANPHSLCALPQTMARAQSGCLRTRPERAPAHVALCTPSRVTYDTGLWTYDDGHHINVNNGGLLDYHLTVPYAVQQADIATGHFGKLYNQRSYIQGYDHQVCNYQVDNQYDYVLRVDNVNQPRQTNQQYLTDDLVDRAIAWLEQQTGEFFLHVSLPSGHEPYTARTDLKTLPASAFDTPWPYRPPNLNVTDPSQPAYITSRGAGNLGDADTARLARMRSMRGGDDAITRLFAALEALGWLDEVAVFLFTDNGSCDREHRWGPKQKRVPYIESIANLLHVWHPALPAEGIDPEVLIGSVDVPATIYELHGVTPAVPQRGLSLVPLLEGGDTTALEERPGLPINCNENNQAPPNWDGWWSQDGWAAHWLVTGETEVYRPEEMYVGGQMHATHAEDAGKLAEMRADFETERG